MPQDETFSIPHFFLPLLPQEFKPQPSSSLQQPTGVSVWENNMTQLELFRLPNGRAWLGEGPFEALAEIPTGGAVFYVNDFDLSDPRPWKRPAKLTELLPGDLDALLADAEEPDIAWTKPLPEWFKMAFRRIRRDVLSHQLDKMVPAVTETGVRRSGDYRALLRTLSKAPANNWAYAHIDGDSGFMGSTPELLFQSEGCEVKTMALAGTAKPGDRDQFFTDLKEIDEHELVADYLKQRLGQLGDVQRDPRGLCETSGLLHFQTRLSVTMDQPASPSELVPYLHPTPAVGCLPREETWLNKLREYRRDLHVPSFFGAPYGFAIDGVCHMAVAIRGLGWSGDSVFLPSGCGIVAGSAFDHEWRELRLKRESVMRLFGLTKRSALAAA